MTHTFKVGDKVKSKFVKTTSCNDEVISELEPAMSESFVESMEQFIGSTGVIIATSGYRVGFVEGPFGEVWNYLPEWLELVDPANPVG